MMSDGGAGPVSDHCAAMAPPAVGYRLVASAWAGFQLLGTGAARLAVGNPLSSEAAQGIVSRLRPDASASPRLERAAAAVGQSPHAGPVSDTVGEVVSQPGGKGVADGARVAAGVSARVRPASRIAQQKRDLPGYGGGEPD